MTYQVRKNAYRFRIGYPMILEPNSKGKIIKLLNSPCHSAPLAKVQAGKKTFYMPAVQGIYEGQEISILPENMDSAKVGDIVRIKNLPFDTRLVNLELRPGDSGKLARTSGTFMSVLRSEKGYTIILTSKKREIHLNENCRAIIGVAAGQGRKIKPVVSAGKKHHMMKARNKLWPRTSAVKMNAVDHPFGSGRGKRIKSKIAKRNAPAGAKVGHIRPSRTGHIR
jgi:large subunit ribosomal protein L2